MDNNDNNDIKNFQRGPDGYHAIRMDTKERPAESLPTESLPGESFGDSDEFVASPGLRRQAEAPEATLGAQIRGFFAKHFKEPEAINPAGIHHWDPDRDEGAGAGPIGYGAGGAGAGLSEEGLRRAGVDPRFFDAIETSDLTPEARAVAAGMGEDVENRKNEEAFKSMPEYSQLLKDLVSKKGYGATHTDREILVDILENRLPKVKDFIKNCQDLDVVKFTDQFESLTRDYERCAVKLHAELSKIDETRDRSGIEALSRAQMLLGKLQRREGQIDKELSQPDSHKLAQKAWKEMKAEMKKPFPEINDKFNRNMKILKRFSTIVKAL